MAMQKTPLLLVTSPGDVPASDKASRLRTTAVRTVAALVVLNTGALALLLSLGRLFPSLLSSGALALSFGLRHAVDADHIAAIDNVTSRLIQDGKRPTLVGLWFSLGHSSVVCLICVATACGSQFVQQSGLFEGFGALVSTAISSVVLLTIGCANLTMLATRPNTTGQHGHDQAGHAHSCVERCFPVLLQAIDAEWKMLLLGFASASASRRVRRLRC